MLSFKRVTVDITGKEVGAAQNGTNSTETGSSCTQYYILSGFGEGSFDIRVTDGVRAWEQAGVTRPSNSKQDAEDWLAMAREALTDPRAGTSYTFEVTEDSEDKLQVEWIQGSKFGRCKIATAEDDPAVIRHVFNALLSSMDTLQVATKEAQSQCAVYQSEVVIALDMIKQFVEQKDQREQELYVKFAAVLNEKKKKAAEWKERAEKAEAALNKSMTENGHGSETSNDEAYSAATEDEDPDAPGTQYNTQYPTITTLSSMQPSLSNEGHTQAPGESIMDLDTQPLEDAAQPGPSSSTAAAGQAQPGPSATIKDDPDGQTIPSPPAGTNASQQPEVAAQPRKLARRRAPRGRP